MKKSLFMNDVMKYIWKDETKTFKYYYDKASSMDENDLYSLLENNKALVYSFDDNNMSSLITCGCHHFQNESVLSGCSMCNLHRKSIYTMALLQAMKDRNEKYYSELVYKSFINARGKVENRTIHEYLFCYDFLDPKEMPDECLKMILSKNSGVFSRRPFIYEFECSARNISIERLKFLKKYLGNSKVTIRIGVECADDFIRNEWLNKDISNNQIINAIKCCKEMGINIIGNILMGIPGFTEKLSIEQFTNSVYWAFEQGIDGISCSILGRSNKSLQGFIYDSLKDSTILQKHGLAFGEHTGLPWMFSLIKALDNIYINAPQILNKIYFGQFVNSYIEQEQSTAYNYSRECSCNDLITTEISKGQIKEKWLDGEMKAQFKNDKCYPYYLSILEKQDKIKTVQENMLIVAQEINKNIWNDANDSYNWFANNVNEYNKCLKA